MSARAKLVSDLKFMLRTIGHPFDCFYELRFRQKTNWALVFCIYAACGLVAILRTYYAGFLISYDTQHYGVNNWQLFFSSLFPYFLFALANWSVTTLFDGNGSFAHVVMVLAYALVPKLVCDILYIAISRYVVLEELALLSAVSAIGLIFFCFLVFAGLCVVHEYSPLKNIATIAATAAAAVVILFVCMLYLQITGKVIGFFTTIFTEIMKRR
ncbi:MAG: YIP1 family protein [Clostridiales bacterium]|jgi:hypothetical protein|nr:YIP1 family protein [Clostridiales bacterium]MDR2749831.1 YIP1 family protein [Clostridiales bacterium]